MPDLFSAMPAPLRPAPARPVPTAPALVTLDRAGRLIHRCAVCRALPAPFGFAVSISANRSGRWACTAHRDQVEAMP